MSASEKSFTFRSEPALEGFPAICEKASPFPEKQRTSCTDTATGPKILSRGQRSYCLTEEEQRALETHFVQIFETSRLTLARSSRLRRHLFSLSGWIYVISSKLEIRAAKMDQNVQGSKHLKPRYSYQNLMHVLANLNYHYAFYEHRRGRLAGRPDPDGSLRAAVLGSAEVMGCQNCLDRMRKDKKAGGSFTEELNPCYTGMNH